MFVLFLCFVLVFVFLLFLYFCPVHIQPLSRHSHATPTLYSLAPLSLSALSPSTLSLLYSHSLSSLLPSLSTLTPTLTVPSQYHCTPLHTIALPPHHHQMFLNFPHTITPPPTPHNIPYTITHNRHLSIRYLPTTYPLLTRYLPAIHPLSICYLLTTTMPEPLPRETYLPFHVSSPRRTPLHARPQKAYKDTIKILKIQTFPVFFLYCNLRLPLLLQLCRPCVIFPQIFRQLFLFCNPGIARVTSGITKGCFTARVFLRKNRVNVVHSTKKQ